MDMNLLEHDRTMISNVKRRFFALRNGIIADTMRRAGMPHRMIFGLNLPQLKEIAAVFGVNHELAVQLWDDVNTRESRLLAPMVADRKVMTAAVAVEWALTLRTVEEADILCHALLRHLPEVPAIASALCSMQGALQRYCGLRLLMNTLAANRVQAAREAQAELDREQPANTALARAIIDELQWLE